MRNVAKRTIGAGSIAMVAVLLFASVAFAAYALFGDAQIVTGGNPGKAAQIRSDATVAPGFGGVDFDVPPGLPWSDLDMLQIDYNVTDDDCGGGSPRFQINVDTTGDGVSDGNVHVAIGPSPNFTDCAPGWQSTGNLIGNEDSGRYDYSQFGGSPFTRYSNVPASVQAGTVVGIQVVVDGSWNTAATGGDGEQTVLVDNAQINDVTNQFEQPLTKDECKNDGWKTLTRADGTNFKNQGDCIQYVNTGK
jgi:hypothetical protein